MSNQYEKKTVLRAAIAEAVVWACIAFSASWVVFFIGSIIQESAGYKCEILRVLFYPVDATTKCLISKNIISSENWPGGLLIGCAIPWMIAGFLFGFYRGASSRPSAMSEKPGCLMASAVVILMALIVTVLLFVI